MSGQPPRTPDQELAAETTKALVEAQIIGQGKAAKLEEQIASGAMREGDWRLLFEIQRLLRNPGADHG